MMPNSPISSSSPVEPAGTSVIDRLRSALSTELHRLVSARAESLGQRCAWKHFESPDGLTPSEKQTRNAWCAGHFFETQSSWNW